MNKIPKKVNTLTEKNTMVSPSPRQLVRLPTVEVYNKWADVYDHDGNILQIHDDLAFVSTVPPLLSKNPPKRILDLGCGTGRNTTKLIDHLSADSEIIAVDVSEGMMRKAQERLSTNEKEGVVSKITWVLHDINDINATLQIGEVDAIVSTLVLEHLYLDRFFETVASVLRKGGWLYLTNMHPEQGEISRAGFVGEQNGQEVKIQGVSFNYKIEEILAAAEKVGLVLMGEVKERGVDDKQHAESLGERAVKWIGIKMHVEMTFFMQ